MSPDNDRADPARPGVLRRIGRAALSPWLSLRISERVATLRRDLDEFRSGDRRAASRVRLDETGGVRSRGHGVPAWAGAPDIRGNSGEQAAVDGAQCVDFSRPRGDVLCRVALSACDRDLDRECDADRIAVHPGLRGVLPARVP
jgi:hypothetical protein